MGLLIALYLPVCTAASYALGSWLREKPLGSRRRQWGIAGILPTLAALIALTLWHFQAEAAYARGPQTGFMSPLVILIYAFPYFALNLVANLYAARRAVMR
jgi:hypothetical protein